MSDFVRIMRGWTSMCNEQDDCLKCPLFHVMCVVPYQSHAPKMMIKAEQIIESWLKDHPLPSTPTWIKWLSENGIVDSTEDGNVKLLPLAYYPMDEEIAKKLGELKNG